MKPVVLIPGSPEWLATWKALAQFVENGAIAIHESDDRDLECLCTNGLGPDVVEAAERVLAEFDAVFHELAETPPKGPVQC